MRLGEKSVVRGGYGLYFPTSAAQGIRDPLSTNAFNQTTQKRSLGFNQQQLQPWPFPLTGGDVVQNTIYTSSLSFNAVPVNLQQPRLQQYNATYERELGLRTSVRFSYLGITSSGLIGGKDLNEIEPSNVPWGTTPYPTLGDYLSVLETMAIASRTPSRPSLNTDIATV